MFTFIQRLPIILGLFTSFGVLLHDTQLDSAAVTALKLRDTSSEMSKLEPATSRTPHTHVEHAKIKHMHGKQPSMQPRNEQEKKYVSQRKSPFANGFGHDYMWPSV
jgi:hypothetical protein